MQKNHAKRTALALFLLFAVTVSAQAAKIAEVIPVSYTHLDVYKRQSVHCAESRVANSNS